MDKRFTLNCFACGEEFQMGLHSVYEGKFVQRYDITVCDSCYKGNWDGWHPKLEQSLIDHLEERGLPIPERNEQGWLPRD
jgi:hypothetical protein